MPTEHEYKYVLSLDILEDSYPWHLPHQMAEICQGYISPETVNLRVRKKTQYFRTEWYITFKQKVGDRTIELESDIDSRDGEDLWRICVRKLTKTRHTFHMDGLLSGLELDVFLAENDRLPYFAMAEVEMPEGASPPNLPEWLRWHVLFEVPLTDDRFSNKMLGDQQYACELYKTLRDIKLQRS